MSCLGDAAADARAVHLRDVDLVLFGDAAHQRRRLLAATLVRRVVVGWPASVIWPARRAGPAVAALVGSTAPRRAGRRRRRQPCRLRRRCGRTRRRAVRLRRRAFLRCLCSCAPVLLSSLAPARPASPSTATTVSMATVSPSCTRISRSTPAAGDGISASTLSVEISKIGSSRSTVSPTFLIQRTTVPSATDSPIWGITTFVGIGISAYGLRQPAAYLTGRLQAAGCRLQATCESALRASRAPPHPPPPTSSDAPGWCE